MSNMTHLYCNRCGKSVSYEVPSGVVVLARIECPECVVKHTPKPAADVEEAAKRATSAIIETNTHGHGTVDIIAAEFADWTPPPVDGPPKPAIKERLRPMKYPLDDDVGGDPLKAGDVCTWGHRRRRDSWFKDRRVGIVQRIVRHDAQMESGAYIPLSDLTVIRHVDPKSGGEDAD